MIDKTESKAPDPFQRLLFRRQFLLGPKQFAPNQYWSYTQLLQGLHLSVHNDLPFTSESHSGVTVTLIGLAIDPYQPQRTESDILHSLFGSASDLISLIDATKPLAGRWIIIFQNPEGTYLFTDPCGFRQIFYHSDGKHVWCASQPELINANHKLALSTDVTLLHFLRNPEFVRMESAWVGTRTIYDNCFHLLPNHYLNVGQLEQIRFYPDETIPEKETSEIVEASASILQGIMTGIAIRYNATFALTAGWDSRVLLAASKKVFAHMEYFIDRKGVLPKDHPDVWVPEHLAKTLNIEFVVKNSCHDLPGWFISMLSENVTGARVLLKTRMIYDKLVTGDKRININGNAGEICRNYFDKYCERDPREICSGDLVRLFGYESMPSYVLQEISEWRKSLYLRLIEGLNIFDMLYWEQRLGNWGAQYPAEQDIAVDEISPFNCRLLIELFMSSPRHMRAAPNYPLYEKLIQKMWPEVLSLPINPTPKANFINVFEQKARLYIPSTIVQVIKKLLKN